MVNVKAKLIFGEGNLFLRAGNIEQIYVPGPDSAWVPQQLHSSFITKPTSASDTIGYRIDGGAGQWDLKLFIDGVDAELNTGEAVPRIPASRVGFTVDWTLGVWSAGLDFFHVNEQDDVAAFELPTDSYDQLDLSVPRFDRDFQ